MLSSTVYIDYTIYLLIIRYQHETIYLGNFIRAIPLVIVYQVVSQVLRNIYIGSYTSCERF